MTGNDINHIELIIPLFKSESCGLFISSFLKSNKIINIEEKTKNFYKYFLSLYINHKESYAPLGSISSMAVFSSIDMGNT